MTLICEASSWLPVLTLTNAAARLTWPILPLVGLQRAYYQASYDPIVHTHANALLTGSGTTRIVLADLREPEAILGHPKVGELIDFGEPVGLLLVAIVHFLTDDEGPAGILARLRHALAPGSFLVLSHGTADFQTEAARQAAAVYDQATSTITLRSHARITAFFDGWELIEPGLVQMPLWRPEGKPPRPKELSKIWGYGGVGRRGT